MRQLLLAMLLGLGSALAQADIAGLQERLAGFTQLSGRFEQVLQSDGGATLESSGGEFALLRPAYLRWHILEPEEQLLVASGDSFWHYDVELETATRRRIDPGNPQSPLAILSGDSAVLSEYYQVESLDASSWTLTPQFADAEFESVTLLFDGDLPIRMDIRDRLGRTSSIQFVELDAGPGLAPGDFSFTPPAGVDIYSDES